MFEEYRQISTRIAELEQEVRVLRRERAELMVHEESDHALLEGAIRPEIFDSISACMFVVDVTSDGRFRIARFNKAEQEAVGLSNEQVAGRFVEDVFSDEIVQEVLPCYRRAIEAGRPINYDSDLNLPVGRRSFHTSLIPLRNHAGRIHRIIGACIDITDSKLSLREAFARQRLETVGVLAGGIAHDCGNLLGSILAESEVLLADLSADSPVRDGIGDIRNVAIRASEIVRELMAYVGPEIPVWEPVDISTLVREMLLVLKASISKRVRLIVDLPSNLPTVHGNPTQIRQVVMNLVRNASEALIEKEGVISLSVGENRLGPGSREVTSTLRAGDYIRLEIKATGPGMTEEVKAKVDLFDTTKSAERGLGLAAPREVIRAHGGAIIVLNTPGQGSQFAILLPSSGQPAFNSTKNSKNMDAPGRGSSGTVLFVEDEELLRRVASKALRGKGVSVIEAADGRTALDIFRANQNEIDVVLLDLTLPGVSGQEVLKELRRIEPNVRVILTTAYSEEAALSTTAGQEPWRFIRKPYRLAELMELLRSGIDRPSETDRDARGLIVMCMYCRRTLHRSPAGEEWIRVEEFNIEPPLHVSHGLCPECLDKHYPADSASRLG
jgi:PAS domain S-box-containing protein